MPVDYTHPGSADPIAGTPEWDAFLDSAVWQDIRNFLLEKGDLVKNDLLSAGSWEEVVRLQEEGKITNIMLNLPDFLKQFAKTNEVKDAER